MRHRNVIVSAVVVVAAVLCGPETGAQNPFRLKPGAHGKLCLECHVTFEDTLQLSSVHTPVQSGDCSGCHNPHATAHGKLLDAETDRICSTCHEGLVAEAPRSSHPDVASGECVACHDPHASEHANNLLQAPGALCASCHTDFVDSIATVQFRHNPVEKNCLSCHDPHASADSDHLLKSDEPGLCLECHDASRATFSQQHMGYPVAEGRCSSCHDPHGSDSRGMLWASVHRPITNKMCNQCHNAASSADALQVRNTGLELCRGCHNSMLNETLAKSRLHWPLADGVSCGHCHTPHASKHADLLTDEPLGLCGECHADTIAQQARSVTKHVPVEEGECSACHSAHASDNAYLLTTSNSFELCGDCHDWKSHSTHPIGEKFVDPRAPNLTLDCGSCHLNHGSPFAYFAPQDPKDELCMTCHKQFQR